MMRGITKSAHSKTIQPNSQFDKERSYYEEIIDKLTKQNELLKKQLEAFTDFNKSTQDIHRAETREDENSSSDLWRSQKGSFSAIQHTTINSEQIDKASRQDMIRENKSLRNQLDLRSKQYQQQISELTDFLNSMKQKQVTPTLSAAKHSGQLWASNIVDVIESMITVFQNDRSAFISKIQELLLLISAYQKREKEHFLKERQFQLQLRIANQQLVIFKRLKKIH